MNLNKEFLQKMVDHLKTVKDENFNMFSYIIKTEKDEQDNVCGTVGCVIGTCALGMDYDYLLEKHYKLPIDEPLYIQSIEFGDWTADRVFNRSEIGYLSDLEENLFRFMFGSYWVNHDNTVLGARKRMQFIINMSDEELQDATQPSYMRNYKGDGFLLNLKYNPKVYKNVIVD